MLGGVVQAAEPEIENLKIGGQYHFRLLYSDDGLNDAEPTREASARTLFENAGTKFMFHGNLYDDVYVRMRYNALSSKLDYGYVKYTGLDDVALTFGQTKERLFGWHRRLTSAVSIVVAEFHSLKPFSYPKMVEVQYDGLPGHVLIQVANDYFNCPATGDCISWNQQDADGEKAQDQPAILAEWIGEYGSFQPLAQYASYDQGKSYTYTLGLRYKNDTYDVYGDYVVDNRVYKGATTGQPIEEENILTGWVVQGEMKVGQLTPYVHVSSFDYEQYTAAGGDQPEINSAYGRFDDNAMTVSVGTHFDNWGPGFRPYAALIRVSGDYQDPEDATASKTLAEMQVVGGVTGDF
jgi:hypothetical protein